MDHVNAEASFTRRNDYSVLILYIKLDHREEGGGEVDINIDNERLKTCP